MTNSAPGRIKPSRRDSALPDTAKPTRYPRVAGVRRSSNHSSSTNVAISTTSRRFWQQRTSRLPLIEVPLPTLTADEEQSRLIRLRWWLAIRILATLGIAMGSIIGAFAVAHVILRGVPVLANSSAAVNKQAVTTPVIAVPVAVVAIGSTQSYANVTLTIDNQRIVTQNEFVAAPAGKEFIIVTVHIFNSDSRQSIPYNAGNYVLIDIYGQHHLPDFAALAHPLGAGEVAPRSKIFGDIAYIVTVPTLTTAPDPQLWYIPDNSAVPVLSWSVPSLNP